MGSTARQAALLRSFIELDLVVLDDLFLARRISEGRQAQMIVHRRIGLRWL